MTHVFAELCLLLVGSAVAPPEDGKTAPAFELLDGDRVVFVGNTFIERDQAYGYLETMLTARWPDRNITFRNLGWSGDTVWGEARARFGSAADGFQHLKEHVEAIKPTVIFVGYGANESFDGEAGLPKFEKGLNTLLDMLAAVAAPKARFVLLSPLRQENLGPPLPDPGTHNADVKLYTDAIRRVADARGHRFVSLDDLIRDRPRSAEEPTLTDNGIHLTPFGYWSAATAIVHGLGCPLVREADGRIGPDGVIPKDAGFMVCRFEKTPSGCRFELVSATLPAPNAPSFRKNSGIWVFPPRATIDGLEPGTYRFRFDGAKIPLDGNDGAVPVLRDYSRADELRRAIIEKNHLYFHRWRPQNETYLFGFRKHEQGNNAAEIPKFDPLVEEQEKLIAKLRVPVKHTYELIREEGGK